MTVYVLVSECWESTTVEGVYATVEGAKAAYLTLPGLEWRAQPRQGSFYVEGTPYGSNVFIEPYELKQ